ncbi:proteoglycan 4-like [Xiphophorus maculatus]|uniref:proteoglycan 4-like n=1 Tax=Xiphophorus maculatus TaxID=8083 RepID=UPI0003B38355|nr:proteoglycan 4-like [Xiphophorus maculatus]
MMSYLWILLLGSLLASHAKAQDEGDVTVAPETEETATEPADPGVDGEADGAAETEAPETEGEIDTAADLQPTADPDPAADPEPTPEPEPAADPDPAADPEPTPEPDPAADPEPTPEPGPAADPDPAADPEPTAEPELAADPEPTAGPEPEADPEPTAGPEADPEPTAVPEPENENLGEELETSTAPSAGVTTPAAPTEDGSGAVTLAAGAEPAPSTVAAEIEPSATPQVNSDADVEVPEQTTPVPEVADTTAAPYKPEVDEETAQKATLIPPINEIMVKGEGRKIYNPGPAEVGASTEDPEESKPKSSKNLAAILSGIIVSAVGAVSGYFAYQKRNLCFKKSQEPDLEGGADKAAAAEAKSEPHEQNTLLENSNQQPSD